LVTATVEQSDSTKKAAGVESGGCSVHMASLFCFEAEFSILVNRGADLGLLFGRRHSFILDTFTRCILLDSCKRSSSPLRTWPNLTAMPPPRTGPHHPQRTTQVPERPRRANGIDSSVGPSLSQESLRTCFGSARAVFCIDICFRSHTFSPRGPSPNRLPPILAGRGGLSTGWPAPFAAPDGWRLPVWPVPLR
jgi:hypothetical protein